MSSDSRQLAVVSIVHEKKLENYTRKTVTTNENRVNAHIRLVPKMKYNEGETYDKLTENVKENLHITPRPTIN